MLEEQADGDVDALAEPSRPDEAEDGRPRSGPCSGDRERTRERSNSPRTRSSRGVPPRRAAHEALSPGGLTACKAAKAPQRTPHDFRRTAVRNLERAGVPRSAAMRMVGHKTEAIYRRDAIADESMLREGAAKVEALLQAQRDALPGGGPAENRQSFGKVSGWRHAVRGCQRRGTH